MKNFIQVSLWLLGLLFISFQICGAIIGFDRGSYLNRPCPKWPEVRGDYLLPAAPLACHISQAIGRWAETPVDKENDIVEH